MNKYTGATDDSREVGPGMLFISRPSDNAQKYLDEAIARGAAAVMLPTGSALDLSAAVSAGMDVIKSADIMLDSARVAMACYTDLPPHICAVTGTKGKTSVAAFVVQILKMMGKKAASIGTLGVNSDFMTLPGRNTTPFALELRNWLSQLRAGGAEYVVIEASSHGIEQRRLEFMKFDSVGFTNFSRDHLDYHGTMENYLAAKRRLFSDFDYKTAVLNADDWASEQTPTHGEKITFGRDGRQMKILNITASGSGQVVWLNYCGVEKKLETSLIGEFQIYNALMAIGLVCGMGFAPESLPIEGIFTQLRAPRGRAEFIGTTTSGGSVYVDYAHTPDSLQKILETLRRHTQKKLHLVFGCGGNRDAGKRPLMGEIASRLADFTTVTDDNPRNEAPEEIRRQVIAQCPNAANIGDREEAIKIAMSKLRDGDLLVIAGKGHETVQLARGVRTHFDDAETVRKYL